MRSIDCFGCFSVVIWEYWHLLPSVPIFSLLRELSASGLFFPFCTVKLYGESVCCIIVCLHFYRPWISTTQQLCVYPNVATRGLFCSCYHCAYHRCDSGSCCLLYFESIWWRLFQKRVVRHKFAIYVNMTRSIPLLEDY